ncbi:MAG TPA: TetR/AcrR family transcriptional regulator [Terracidiphilus sp.]|nr:TetR/AcrR family transcriptional regulator [Terracidiphilus sp.]
MRTWPSNDPKAALMGRKRLAIVRAARLAFLEGGYEKTSMDSIAQAAGVGIKTVYRHFENKDDLFSAVMQAACNPDAFDEVSGKWTEPAEEPERPWFSKPPHIAFVAAGIEYLEHVLSDEQLALYRVVTRDAHSFPELGRRYKEQVVERSYEVFIHYLNRWVPSQGWKIRRKQHAAEIFVALLRAGIYDDVLHGLRTCSAAEIAAQSRRVAKTMLALLESGCC